jgi:hypothetical protein
MSAGQYLDLTEASTDPTTGPTLGPFYNSMYGSSFQIVWDGTVTVTTVQVQASDDPRAFPNGVAESSAKWSDVSSSLTIPDMSGGAGGSEFINFTFGNWIWVRLYLATFGGAGNIDVWFKGPVV